MESQKESCPIKTSLLVAWQKASEIYSKAVAELTRQIGTVPKVEYQRLAKAAELAGKDSHEAQAALEAHTNEHRCDGNGGEVAA
jgi:hypothetical protein